MVMVSTPMQRHVKRKKVNLYTTFYFDLSISCILYCIKYLLFSFKYSVIKT